jgi:hypothetical protein
MEVLHMANVPGADTDSVRDSLKFFGALLATVALVVVVFFVL